MVFHLYRQRPLAVVRDCLDRDLRGQWRAAALRGDGAEVAPQLAGAVVQACWPRRWCCAQTY